MKIMKKVFCLTIVLLSAISIFAQEKTIEKSEFDAALKNRFLKFAGQSYRQTTRAELTAPSSDKTEITWKSVREVAPRISRTLYEFDSPTIKTRRETIIVSGKIYTRKDGGEWTEQTRASKDDKPTAPERKFEVVEEQTEYKWVGTEILDKLNTSVYAKIEKKKMVIEANKREMYTTSVTKYWLDQDGGIIKEETLRETRFKSEVKSSGNVSRNLETSVWEFDPNIKIEVPVLAR